MESASYPPNDSRRHAVILGCPGSGRTLTAVTVAKELQKLNPAPAEQPVVVVAADRVRTDIIQPVVEQLLPGVVRPVRTPVSLAFSYTSAWAVERSEPQLAPQLLTGAQEDAELAEILRGYQIAWPQWITDEVTIIPAFRMELRNLLARTREAGWDAATLREMGRRAGRDMWVAGAELMNIWDCSPVAQGNSERPALLSSAQLQERAAHLISQWPQRASEEGVRARLWIPYAVVVDDLQDCTGATLSLLESLAKAGSRIIATADSDVAVATYRGGEPHLDGRLQRALGANVYELGPSYRGSLALRRVVQGVTSRVTVTGSAKRRAFGAYDPREKTDALAVRVYGSQSQEMTAVAHEIRRHHVVARTPLSDMAVIVRSSADVSRVRFSLMRHGIETTSHRRAINYASDQVTATLLDLLDYRYGTDNRENVAEPEVVEGVTTRVQNLESYETISRDHHTGEGTSEDVFIGMDARDRLERLVASPLGAVNALDLRRLIQASGLSKDSTSLSAFSQQLRNIWEQDSAQQMREHIINLGLENTVNHLFAAARLVELGRQCHSLDPRRALWRLWEAAEVEDQWVERALRNNVESVIFDERLDAVISLMRTADVWSQRNPAGTAAEFAAELLTETLPTDNLAVAGQRPVGVHVLTAAQSVGRQWPVVFVSGVQDGKWPNLTLRDRLSRAGEVTEVANGTIAVEDLARGGNTMVAMRRSALNEELRMLAVAVSRATEYLTVTACRTEDLAPSSFVDLCAALTDTKLSDDGTVPTTPVPPGVDTRSLIARLRFILAQPHEEPHRRELAAKLLALMAREGIREADPATWTGVGGMTDLQDRDDRPRLSPSAIEVLLTCPARWFMTRHGGDVPFSAASRLGTLVHEIAEEFPYADPDTLLRELEQRWDDHEFDRAHAIGRKYFEETKEKVIRMGEYFQSLGDSRVETEYNVYVELDHAIITGTVDRVETVDEGVRVTDIKTGNPGSKKGTKDHLQLALYQYALYRLGYPVVGARLLALKDSQPEGFVQPGLFSGTEEANERLATLENQIEEAVRLAKGPTYPAIVTSECRTCPVHNLCPVRDEGLRTIE
ncbi:MAG: PD-(D/E)XK nuclease family protein [Actinomycetaceae bacterium]|nr:PD-(D/E)XK nuclease family protein [Actinomycetaceae bacterium]